jgi:hypothetical protein
VFHWPAEYFSRDKEVITMDMIGKVRRMKLRDKLSLSEIARNGTFKKHGQEVAQGGGRHESPSTGVQKAMQAQ